MSSPPHLRPRLLHLRLSLPDQHRPRPHAQSWLVSPITLACCALCEGLTIRTVAADIEHCWCGDSRPQCTRFAGAQQHVNTRSRCCASLRACVMSWHVHSHRTAGAVAFSLRRVITSPWDVYPHDLSPDAVAKAFKRPSDLFASHALPTVRDTLASNSSRKEIRHKVQSMLESLICEFEGQRHPHHIAARHVLQREQAYPKALLSNDILQSVGICRLDGSVYIQEKSNLQGEPCGLVNIADQHQARNAIESKFEHWTMAKLEAFPELKACQFVFVHVMTVSSIDIFLLHKEAKSSRGLAQWF
jgi:hypothetical protein